VQPRPTQGGPGRVKMAYEILTTPLPPRALPRPKIFFPPVAKRRRRRRRSTCLAFFFFFSTDNQLPQDPRARWGPPGVRKGAALRFRSTILAAPTASAAEKSRVFNAAVFGFPSKIARRPSLWASRGLTHPLATQAKQTEQDVSPHFFPNMHSLRRPQSPSARMISAGRCKGGFRPVPPMAGPPPSPAWFFFFARRPGSASQFSNPSPSRPTRTRKPLPSTAARPPGGSLSRRVVPCTFGEPVENCPPRPSAGTPLSDGGKSAPP